jgi:hypothetical protein
LVGGGASSFCKSEIASTMPMQKNNLHYNHNNSVLHRILLQEQWKVRLSQQEWGAGVYDTYTAGGAACFAKRLEIGL